jgi:hypothetical protein
MVAGLQLMASRQAMLPLRLLLSVRLAPPLANIVVKRFSGLRALGKKYMQKTRS